MFPIKIWQTKFEKFWMTMSENPRFGRQNLKNFGWRWANEVSERMKSKMKKDKEKKVKNKEQRKYDKGQVFVKIMAGILALLMILSVAGSLVFYLL